MKKILSVLMIFIAWNVKAETVSEWENIYKQVSDSYVYYVSIEDLAVAGMKGIKEVDNKLTVADDASRITLYYNGRVVKVLRKPENENDAGAWGKVTSEIIAEAAKKSKKANLRDFELTDFMAKSMITILDKDSKFYENTDDVKRFNIRNKRLFSANLKDDVLVVKIGAFNKKTLSKTKEVLENVEAKALIIDLRGCPGGMTGEAIAIADMFLDEGIVTSVKGKNENEEVYYNADDEKFFDDKPIFVLVDGETASSAEILAIALKEQSRAKVIGTTTQGKASTQKLISLENGSVLAITNGFFNSPSGENWHNKGVEPDVCTFERGRKNMEESFAEVKTEACGKESREDSDLESELAMQMLKEQFFLNE